MFVDASALVSIVTNESDGVALAEKVREAQAYTSPITLYETVAAVIRIKRCSAAEAQEIVNDTLDLLEIKVVTISASTAALALDAFDRFGKGRHPAGLNMGDCFAYACARENGLPLLFKGDDFGRTDIAAA